MKAIVYTGDTCPNCKIVKEYLTEQGVEFEERNISLKQVKVELMKKGFMSVPVTIINDVTILGFNKEEIDLALEQ